jgi:hypothetical protein
MRYLTLMRLICSVRGCPSNVQSCACTRCGRPQHKWKAAPQVMESDFELVGHDRYGNMLYEQSEHHEYTCIQCGKNRLVNNRFRVKR